ncbi:transporter substrate-binding domain-containing protein [Rhodobacteraceae bacterium D3-12]|nr:transporter substrate-binding domain-containing protein [Rhodobacteraceae bacterium D3-12]
MKTVFKIASNAAVVGLMALGAPMAQAQSKEPAPTIKQVQERGHLLCPSHVGTYKGFAEVDDKGEWQGLDIELCRAVATMMLGDKTKVELVPLSWAQRFPALQSGDVDIIIKVTGWTMSRDTEQNLQFSMPYFVGGTQFAVRKDLGITSAKELNGASICVAAGTSLVRFASNWLEGQGLEFKMIQFEKDEEAQSAYNAGRCDSYIQWGPNLAVFLTNAKGGTEENMVLPELVDFGLASITMREGEQQLVDSMNWLISILLQAEFEGVNSQNVDEMRANPTNPTVAKLLGVDPGLGERLGLRDDWAYDVIKQVGNYSEIYHKTMGDKSPYKLPRGFNNLWNNGGVLYPLTLD